MRRTAILLIAAMLPPAAYAFNGHTVVKGPLTVEIAEIPTVTKYVQPQDVRVTLTNSSSASLQVDLVMKNLVDEWYAVGKVRQSVRVAANSKAAVLFKIACAEGAFSALYPVHVYATFDVDGSQATAHAVRIFQTEFSPVEPGKTGDLPAVSVPANGALPLWQLDEYQVAWRYFDRQLVEMPVGWRGASQQSRATFSRGPATRGATRQALQMHPPYTPEPGTIFARYRVRLPETAPITLTFGNAIRDHHKNEPPSDGVTFRVWAEDEKLFERHTDAKRWIKGRVDLSRFAGRIITLKLESHPGPENNTVCDSSFWAEPLITAGIIRARVTAAQRNRLRERAKELALNGRGAQNGELLFRLDGGITAAVALGPTGLPDAAIAFAQSGKTLTFEGVDLSILGNSIGSDSSVAVVGPVTIKKESSRQTATIIHPITLGANRFELTARVFKQGPALRISVQSPKRITDFALAPADQKALRVYYGHGYCIENPQAFRAGFGGHNLSTSHVGFDFARGLSLLVATDNPPDYLQVEPDGNYYALHTHMNATMTLVPGSEGAFDCAFRYRPLYDKQASDGFARKAGRFVFDIWGGKYAGIAEKMQRMIDYGLTDSLLTVHVWQRWGYDYRLPDIYPPQPGLGTVEDMQKIGLVCNPHDIPWGLHDNYIDFYPDAEGYSYDHIAFTESGQPIKAWLNEGREAQSYRWRPDRFLPFAKRNLSLIKPGVAPTHYFIDVFTSIGPFDFYDRHGNFHSSLETRRHWGEVFAWIRDYLGGNAPQTSEAGHDQLIGYLDGADCQHLQITPDSRRFCIRIPCEDWQRVPWFDAVLHDKFSLHGVGYSGRYQGGRPRRSAGIESDDYISAEILEGHALMIDRGAFGSGAVRKYYLAQDFIRSIATDTIDELQFVDDNIHRQKVCWSSGAEVYVNRDRSDWRTAGKILPRHGYYAKNGPVESSIERIDGVIVEQSKTEDTFYCNARGFNTRGDLAIRPIAEKIEYLGNRSFRLSVRWEAASPAPKDLAIFTHFLSDESDRKDRIAFQSDGATSTPTTGWKGDIITNKNAIVIIPQQYGPGEYDITIGLWDPETGKRYVLIGEDDGSTRYRIGKLIVKGAGKSITDISLQPNKYTVPSDPRENTARVAVDFGPVKTAGAVKCIMRPGSVTVIPLPDLDSFKATLDLAALTGIDNISPKAVWETTPEGEKVKRAACDPTGSMVSMICEKGVFAYRIDLD